MTTNIFDMTDTWNNGASTFYAIKMNVNNAGSAGDSKLIDLQLGGSSRFNVGVNNTVVRTELVVGAPSPGNAIAFSGSQVGQQGAFVYVPDGGSDPAVNIHIVPKGFGGVNLYSNNALQLSVSGPTGTARYISIAGSIADNPQIIAGGGGRVEINNLLMVGAPQAPTVPDTDSSVNVATTEFVKRQRYVQTTAPVSFNQLAGFTDPPDGMMLQGIDLPLSGLAKAGSALTLTDDLNALENLTGTHTIYYRSGTNTWTPVVTGPSLSFIGDTLDLAAGAGGVTDAEYIVGVSHTGLTAERVLTDTTTITWDRSTPGQMKAISTAGGGNVSSANSPLAGQIAQWVTPTTIQGIAPSAFNAVIGAQPVDPQLTALAATTPVADSVPYFTSATVAATFASSSFTRSFMGQVNQAGALLWLAAAPLDSPAFTGTPQSTAPVLSDSSPRIATTAFVKGQGYQTLIDVVGQVQGYAQPLDPDLTSLSAAIGTNTMYYRSAAGWQAVTIGANITFTGGTLAAAAGGTGNVISVGTPASTMMARWTDPTHIEGVTLQAHRTNPVFLGNTTFQNAAGAPIGNGLTMNTTATGGNPTFLATGQDPNVGIFFSSKGDSSIFFYSRNFGTPQLGIGPGQAGSNTFPMFSAGGGQSFLQNNPAGNPINLGSPIVASVSGNKIKGIVDASSPVAGDIGEFQSGTYSTPIALNTATNLSGLVVTAGDWEVWVQGYGTATAGATTMQMSIATTAFTYPAGATLIANIPAGNTVPFFLRVRVNVSSTSTAYLTALTGVGGPVTFTGGIFARRVN